MANLTGTDINKLTGITNGTQAAAKAVIADANINTGISKVTELHIGSTGSEAQVTATPAELNLLDTAVAGTVVNSKAVIYSAGGAVNGTSLSAAANITGNTTAYTSSTKLVYRTTLDYNNTSGNIILFDANAIIWSIKVSVADAWNSSVSDVLDIGVTASANQYQDNLNLQVTGWSLTTTPTVANKPGATYVTYAITSTGDAPGAGALEIYVEYSLY